MHSEIATLLWPWPRDAVEPTRAGEASRRGSRLLPRCSACAVHWLPEPLAVPCPACGDCTLCMAIEAGCLFGRPIPPYADSDAPLVSEGGEDGRAAAKPILYARHEATRAAVVEGTWARTTLQWCMYRTSPLQIDEGRRGWRCAGAGCMFQSARRRHEAQRWTCQRGAKCPTDTAASVSSGHGHGHGSCAAAKQISFP